jgi:hypothetical protein
MRVAAAFAASGGAFRSGVMHGFPGIDTVLH